MILKSLFELRLASLIGYMPSLIACAECGEFETDPMYFNEMTGELFCCNCKGSGAKYYPLEVISAMRHAVFSEFDKMFSLQIGSDNITHFAYASEKYLTSVLKRKFRTLDFYKAMINE